MKSLVELRVLRDVKYGGKKRGRAKLFFTTFHSFLMTKFSKRKG